MSDDKPIHAGTLARLAPEVLNQWSGPQMIELARQQGGEAMAWGVAYALRLERERLGYLLQHFAGKIGAPGPGSRLAQRIVACARAARREWREPRWR